MKVILFGATGGTGGQVIQQACEAGHEVTALVRDASRLTRSHPRLTVLQADVMDLTAIVPAIAGSDAVVSVLGPRGVRVPTTVRSDAVTSMVTAMQAEGVRRLIVVTAGGIVTEGDGPLTRLVLKPVVGTILRHSFADMRRTEDIVRASGLEWTIVRPPRLTDGPRTASYRSATNRNVRGGMHISRADLADCILQCLAQQGPLHTAVSVAD
jgi:putative NADH-flavin reductase